MSIIEIAGISVVAGHWLVMVALATRVVLRKGEIGASLAWLTIIFFLPYGGAALYLLIGEIRGRRAERIREHRSNWVEQLNIKTGAHDDAIAEYLRPIQRQATHKAGFAAQAGNRVELLDGADAFFDQIIADIDNARESLALEFFIWDAQGRAADVNAAIVRAAKRGLRCRILVDSVGSRGFLRSSAVRKLRAHGVQVVESLQANVFRLIFRRLDLRNHRKIVVIDGRIGYVGSQNLVDPAHFKKDAGVGPWVDLMVRVSGPAVIALLAVLEEDWELEHLDQASPSIGLEVEEPGATVVQVVPSGPSFRPQAIRRLLLSVIYSARSSLVLSTPYFVPEESMLSALISARQQGVDVTLIVPRKVDSRLVRYASRSHYQAIIDEGIRIMHYDGGLLHSKTITVDDQLSVIGSVNLDMRSMLLNFEISVLIYDQGFCRSLRDLQASYMRRSEPLHPESWRARPLHDRVLEGFCRLLGPML